MPRHAAAHNRWTNYAAGARQHREAMMDKTHGFNMQLAEQGHGFNLERDTHQNELGADWRDFQKSHMTDSHNIARERLAQEGSHFNMGFDQRDRHHASARDLLERQFGHDLNKDDYSRHMAMLGINHPDLANQDGLGGGSKRAYLDENNLPRIVDETDHTKFTGGSSGKPGGDGSGQSGGRDTQVDPTTGFYIPPDERLRKAFGHYGTGEGVMDMARGALNAYSQTPLNQFDQRATQSVRDKVITPIGQGMQKFFNNMHGVAGLSPAQKLDTANQNAASQSSQSPAGNVTWNETTDEQLAAIRKVQKEKKKDKTRE